MDYSLNDDQRQVLEFLGSLTRPYGAVPLHDAGFSLESEELDSELAENGFLDAATIDELGLETAVLVIEALARLPVAVEAGASALLRPLIGMELPRPFCLVEAGQLAKPVRFLRPGATVVVVGEVVKAFTASEGDVRDAGDETLYAYPMAYLIRVPADATTQPIAPDEVRRLWRVALAAETAGLLAGGLASVVAHVSERQQFGRPLATFQAMRHRLAEAQVLTNGCYWLALQAAGTGDPGDAALAALHAQEAARRVCYDFHQFLGAMGVTLEHPLHLWTYRLKALTAELGGRGAQALAAADAIWGQPGPAAA